MWSNDNKTIEKIVFAREVEINLVKKAIDSDGKHLGMEGKVLLDYLFALQREQASILSGVAQEALHSDHRVPKKHGMRPGMMRFVHSVVLAMEPKGDILEVSHADLGAPATLQLLGARRFLPFLSKHKHGYNLELALRLAEMCDFVYFGPFWWESSQVQSEMTDPTNFSLKAKLFSGQLKFEEKWKHTQVTSPWGVTPVEFSSDHSKSNCFSSSSTWIKGGVINDSETDTQAIVLKSEQREEIYVIFRGTEKGKDAMVDANMARLPNPYGKGGVHKGFLRAYRSVANMLESAVEDLLKTKKYKFIRITGHSLGGALATVAAVAFFARFRHDIDVYDGPLVFPHITVHTFGSPMVGNQAFVNDYDSKLPDSYRHVLDCDLIPLMPPRLCGFRHVRHLVLIKEFGMWIARKPIVVTRKGKSKDFNPGNDHSMTNYSRLLKRHRVVMEMVLTEQNKDPTELTVIKLRDTWNRVMSSRPETRIVSRPADKTVSANKLQVMPSVLQIKQQSLNLQELRDILGATLNRPTIVIDLVESEMRYLARGGQIDFSHLLAACYDLFYDPHAKQHRLWAFVRRNLEFFDLNDDRMLEPYEVRQALNFMKVNLTDPELDELFKSVDLNANGVVSYTEVFMWLVMCMRGDINFGTATDQQTRKLIKARFARLKATIKFIIDDSLTKDAKLSLDNVDENDDTPVFDGNWLVESRAMASDVSHGNTAQDERVASKIDEIEGMLEHSLALFRQRASITDAKLGRSSIGSIPAP